MSWKVKNGGSIVCSVKENVCDFDCEGMLFLQVNVSEAADRGNPTGQAINVGAGWSVISRFEV